MERTLIAFNIPNVITITIMAAVGWAIAMGLMQIAMRQGLIAAPSGQGSY